MILLYKDKEVKLVRAIDTTKCYGFCVTNTTISFFLVGESEVIKLDKPINDEQIVKLAEAIVKHWYDYTVIWLDKLLGDSNAERTNKDVSSECSIQTDKD